MGTHTPGPWHYESGAVWEHEGDGDAPGTVAIALRGSRRGGSEYRSPAEDAANMRLIAAAPELLEACRNLVATLESLWESRELSAPRYVQCQLGTAATHATKAIAKAEGRQGPCQPTGG